MSIFSRFEVSRLFERRWELSGVDASTVVLVIKVNPSASLVIVRFYD